MEIEKLGLEKAKESNLAANNKDVKKIEGKIDEAEKKAKTLKDNLEELSTQLDDINKRKIFQRDNYNHWYNHLSVYFGVSPTEFTGGGLESTVLSAGLGYDVAPGFAILGGWAFYEVEKEGNNGKSVSDTDGNWFLGICLDLDIFKTISNLIE